MFPQSRHTFSLFPHCPDYLKPPPPTFLLSVNITYHTATLLWSIPSEAAINDTYTVLYWGLHSPDSVLLYNDNVHSDIDQMMQASISGLVSGVLYQWSIEAKNSMASSQSTIANFTTASYGRETVLYYTTLINYVQ